MKWSIGLNKRIKVVCLALFWLLLILAGNGQARTNLFFIGPQTVAAVPGAEVTFTVYVKTEKLRAFGFSVLLDTRYVTYVPNSLSRTGVTENFDFLGANLVENQIFDENRPYLKELIIGGSALTPVSSTWNEGQVKHGIMALATFKLKLVDDFQIPPEKYLTVPIVPSGTVNDFKTYRQGGGLLLFKAVGEKEPTVSISEPVFEARYEDANITASGTGNDEYGNPLSIYYWVDPFKIHYPLDSDFIIKTGSDVKIDFTSSSPGLHALYLVGMDDRFNGASDFTVFGIGEDVVVEFFGSIEGIVRSSTTLDPIAGAEVVAYEGQGNDLRRLFSVVTGGSGEFLIEGIGAGTYTLLVHREGYQEGSVSVTLKNDNSTIKNVIIELLPLGRPTGDVYSYINGKFCVFFEDSRIPAQGLRVRDVTGLYSCITREDGCCEIDWLRKGDDFKYMWLAEGEGAYSLVTSPQSISETDPINLSVKKALKTTLDVRVIDPISLVGVKGVQLSLYDGRIGRTIKVEGPTTTSGLVTFQGLEPGNSYVLTATLTDSGKTHLVKQTLSVEKGNNVFNLYLHKFDPGNLTASGLNGGKIILQVVDGTSFSPISLSAQTIYLVDFNNKKINFYFVKDHYETSGLLSGNYTLWVKPPGYRPLEGYRIQIASEQKTGILVHMFKDQKPITTVDNIEAIGKSSISGIVLAKTDLSPIWNAQLIFTLKDGIERFTVRTDASGRFEKRDITPGTYILELQANGYQGVIEELYVPPGTEYTGTLKLFPKTPGKLSEVTESKSNPTFFGTVLSSIIDFSPHPIQGAKVRGLNTRDGSVLFDISTDGAGNFEIDGIENATLFWLEVSASGFEPQVLGPFQLSGTKPIFHPIFLVPQGLIKKFKTSGVESGADSALYFPEEEKLVLNGGYYLDVVSLDPVSQSLRHIGSFGLSKKLDQTNFIFGPGNKGNGQYELLAFSNNTLEIFRLDRGFEGISQASDKIYLPFHPTDSVFRYPNLFIGTERGILSLEAFDGQGQSTSLPLIWNISTIRPKLLFSHDNGIISVDQSGKCTFVETINPYVPVLRDSWSLEIRPIHGALSGGFGIFCDASGKILPIKEGVQRGLFLNGRAYDFNRFKKALVFTIDHPLANYKGKHMAFAVLIEDSWIDILELTDLNPWLLRRYPVIGAKDIFTGKLWVHYSIGQDRYEGAVYYLSPEGIGAIPVPTYLGKESRLDIHGIDNSSLGDSFVFTNKGYLLKLGATYNATSLSFSPDPGSYDVYFVDPDGRAKARTGISSFGAQSVDFSSLIHVDIETTLYPGAIQRVFHPGDDMGILITIRPREPKLVDLYLLTEITAGDSTSTYYWIVGKDGSIEAKPYGDSHFQSSPEPIIRSIFFDRNVTAQTFLSHIPEDVSALSGKLKLLLIRPGADPEKTPEAVIGEDILDFRIN